MASVKIIVPANWRVVAERNLGTLTCEADSVGGALKWLVENYPQFKNRLFTQDGRPASWINIYLGEDSIRDLNMLDTPVKGQATLVVIPAMAGG